MEKSQEERSEGVIENVKDKMWIPCKRKDENTLKYPIDYMNLEIGDKYEDDLVVNKTINHQNKSCVVFLLSGNYIIITERTGFYIMSNSYIYNKNNGIGFGRRRRKNRDLAK